MGGNVPRSASLHWLLGDSATMLLATAYFICISITPRPSPAADRNRSPVALDTEKKGKIRSLPDAVNARAFEYSKVLILSRLVL